MTAIPALTSPFGALSLVVRIGSIGVAISALESLCRRADLGPTGVLDGAAQLTRARWLLPLAFLASPALAVALTWARLLAAGAVIVGGGNFEVARVGVIVIAVATLLLRFRTPLGIHASGTMVMVTFTAAALGLAAGTRLSLEFTLWFIAAQACLAYFVAGASKIAEPSWRTGQAIPLISSTLMWGNRTQALMLRSHHRVALALCWATMLLECAFPLVLAVPLPVTVLLLSARELLRAVRLVVPPTLRAELPPPGPVHRPIGRVSHWRQPSNATSSPRPGARRVTPMVLIGTAGAGGAVMAVTWGTSLISWHRQASD